MMEPGAERDIMSLRWSVSCYIDLLGGGRRKPGDGASDEEGAVEVDIEDAAPGVDVVLDGEL